jgi:hypothetical protein
MISRAAGLIDQEIEKYLPYLNDRQKRAILAVIKTFATGQQDWWSEISKEQQKAIDKSLAEMKAGKLALQDSVLKSIRNGKSTVKNYIKPGNQSW